MLTVTYADPWLEGSVAMEEEVVTATTQMEELNRSLSGQSSSSSSSWSSDNLDDSLTSLHWLQEFSIASASRGPHMSSHQHMEAPTSPLAGDLASIGLSQTPSKPTAASYSRVQTQRISHSQCLEEMDFSTNNVKPPYSYANMIYMAMQASNKPKITLSCIYKWITDNFCYYRHADPTWQNSIRHNLSLNKCFVKVPRQKNEPGKGGFWAIDPQHAERLLSGAYKNRNLPPVRINPAFQNNKRVEVKSEPTLAATAVEHQESCQMLRTYEESIETVPTRDTCLGEAAIESCWVSEEKKSPFASRKVSTSCSPLFSMDVKENLSALNGNFDWDALVDSAMNGDLSMNEGRPLSPDEFLDHGNYFSQDAQVMLESQMSSDSDLENLFPETELNQDTCWNMFEGTGLNILGHTENIEPLFDLEIKIESLP